MACDCWSLTARTDLAFVVAVLRAETLPMWVPLTPAKAATPSPTWTRIRTFARPTKRQCRLRVSPVRCQCGYIRNGLHRKANSSREECETHRGPWACIVVALLQWIKVESFRIRFCLCSPLSSAFYGRSVSALLPPDHCGSPI